MVIYENKLSGLLHPYQLDAIFFFFIQKTVMTPYYALSDLGIHYLLFLKNGMLCLYGLQQMKHFNLKHPFTY